MNNLPKLLDELTPIILALIGGGLGVMILLTDCDNGAVSSIATAAMGAAAGSARTKLK